MNKLGDERFVEQHLDQLVNQAGNKFLLVNVGAQRAKSIADGALPLVDMFSKSDPLTVALKEIFYEKVKFKMVKEPTRAARKRAEAVSTEPEKKPFGGLGLEKLSKREKRKAPKKKR